MAVFAGRRYGGPQTYEKTIINEIARLDPSNEYHVYLLDPGARAAYPDLPQNARCHVLQPGSRWLSISFHLPASLLWHRADLLHATTVAPPVSPVPTVFTMHDVTPFLFPEFYPPAVGARLRVLIKRGVTSSKVVICVSRHARDTTMELFHLPADRLVVIHHGIHPQFRPLPRDQARRCVAESLDLSAPYILHVGHLQRRKNIRRLLEAFHIFRQQTRCDIKLVFCGARVDDIRFIDETLDWNTYGKHVRQLGEVSDEQMPALYNAAEMLAFPTLWEGFGFPVLEAMACGTPVVTSRVSSLPEIAGEAALLVDPHSVDDIASAMCRIATDSALRTELRGRGLERARTFTWEKAARETLRAYSKALET